MGSVSYALYSALNRTHRDPIDLWLMVGYGGSLLALQQQEILNGTTTEDQYILWIPLKLT